jgi:nucleoside-diphosphate-sugar epimerase
VKAILLALTTKTKNEIFNIGAKEFQTWRKDLQFVIDYAKSKSRITSLPVLPSQILLYILEQLHLSPIAAWHYKTMPVPSYVSTQKAEKLLGWKAEKSNKVLLLENYKWYEKNRDEIEKRVGTTHRVGWDFKLLNLVKILG